MNWSVHLDPGEEVRWQGRPAPRCYSFRNWRHSLFGLLLLAICLWWTWAGIELGRDYGSRLYPLIPIPFLLLSIYMAFGHLVVARLEWERVYYAVTDRRILVQRGLFRRRLGSLALGEVTGFRLNPLGEHLGTVRVRGGTPPLTLVLCCIEYPRKMTDLVEEAMPRELYI
ncbi:MAG: hypothetical protein C0617_05115 [Desulfuromonas sp.]|uniref:PH domain-containing protein n=1 Tax=Desulfuromonas sp. TaxID=892 RepID=UPI000CA729A8|nr:PH domain-containing protein [Desulfuromonas sp.]PLX85074.1 MAG: hypothetical protein C0617_05115 [Desulfuromonas sp.]